MVRFILPSKARVHPGNSLGDLKWSQPVKVRSMWAQFIEMSVTERSCFTERKNTGL